MMNVKNWCYFCLCLGIFGMIGCEQSHESQLQEVVKKYVKEEVLEDGKDYESISFSDVDSIYLTLDEHPKIAELEKEILSLEGSISGKRIMAKISIEDSDEHQEALLEMEALEQKMKEKQEALTQFKENYEPELVAYEVQHQFKTKTGEKNKLVRIDTSMNVTSFRDLEKE